MAHPSFSRIVLALLMGQCGVCFADFRPWYFEQVSPRNLNRDIEGATNSLVPFGVFGFPSFSDCDSCRFQQVFAASEFAVLPQLGLYLYALTLRPDACGRQGTTLTNVVIRLSTTSKTPDGLSRVFSENVGIDEVVVYRSALRSVSGLGICVPGFPPQPVSWDQHQYFLNVPFPYSPSKGNLLMEVTYEGKRPFGEGARMDTQTLTNDGVSRVYGCPSSAETAQVADTTGLVAQFLFVLPQLTIQPTESGIGIEWSSHLPASFRLEWSDTVAPGAIWKSFVGAIQHAGSEIYRIEVAKADLAKVRYYRLFSPAPTPASP